MIPDQVFEEATGLLSTYIRIDTSNPPGGEETGALFLQEVLEREGISSSLYQSAPGRSNLLARLKGDGSRGPVLLLHHIDVVGAIEKDWTHPPFGGEIHGGSIWGRGALDCKGLGIMELMAFILLKRNQVPLKRDVILLAVADEETGGELGAGWITKTYPDEVRSEYCLNEGGLGTVGVFGSDRKVFSLAFGEKGVLWLRVRARGKGGHGSMPHQENANDRLIRALIRVLNYETRIQIGKGMKESLAEFGRGSPGRAVMVKLLGNELVLNLFRKRLKKFPKINAVLRNTISLTNLKAGFKENVIPSESEAILDCRILPDQDPGDFVKEVQRIVSGEGIEVEVVKEAHSSQSPVRTDFFQAIAAAIRKNSPEAGILPMLAAGFTDSRFFRNIGSVAYGMIPAIFTSEEIETMHGVDERISLESLRLGIRNCYDIVLNINQ